MRSNHLLSFKHCLACLAIIISLGACTASNAAPDAGPLTPINLRCEYLTNPVGIDVKLPRFGWIDRHTARAQAQSAFQLLVATTPELLAQDKGDAWDSGKTASDDFTHVVYGGKALESNHSYFWKVRWWDRDGVASDYSEPARFGLALLSPDDWKGQWIGGANQLRTDFDLPEAPRRARAYICGLGYYDLRLNGEKIGKTYLDPAWTAFNKRDLYATYDVTANLHRGANAIGVRLGEAWFHGRALKFQLDVELASGKHIIVTSGSDWKVKDGPIVSDSVWDGEVYDARLETPGWDMPGFKDDAWAAAQTVSAPGGVLSAEAMPPIEDVDSMVPRTISNPRPGFYIYDMGQNFSGWVDLHVSGPRGAKVQLRFAELLYDDGMINRENIRGAKARDIYILSGKGEECYHPTFTYHGFRYVEVTGFPGTPSLDSIRGHVVHSAVETTGSFVASKPLINDIHRIIHWSDLTNLMSVPTDCDQRDERMGWMGDAQVSSEGLMLNFDMTAFYSNFLRDMRDAQGPDGSMTDTVPPAPYGGRPASPAWGAAFPLITWYLYQQDGDPRIIEENYDGLKKYEADLQGMAKDNVLYFGPYGDWVATEKTPYEEVADFYYYYGTVVLAKMAAAIGRSDDAQKYAQLAETIKDAFNREFFNAKTSNYANGTQTANALPLFLHMPPEGEYGKVLNNLVNNILYYHDSHLTTGLAGTRYLFPTLNDNNQASLAYDIATQTTYPSWGYMLANGATTVWELWENKVGPHMNSQNHHMLGNVDAWFYEGLGGIKVDAEKPAYQHVLIVPDVTRDLTSVSASVGSVRGRVTSTWSHDPGVIKLTVDIPVGSTATVAVPYEPQMTDVTVHEDGSVVWEKHHFIAGTPGITSAYATGEPTAPSGAFKDERVVFEVGSGHYDFELRGN